MIACLALDELNAIDFIHWTEDRKEDKDLDVGHFGLEKK